MRWRTAFPWVTDAAAVLTLGTMAVSEAIAQQKYRTWAGIHTTRDVAFVSLILAALLFRRRAPVTVLVATAAVTFVWYQFPGGGAWTGDIALVVAAYTVGALRGIGWGIGAIGAIELAYTAVGRGIHFGYWQVGWSLQFGLAVIAGVSVRSSRKLSEELIRQTELLERAREERVRLAVDHERTRIARDMHDMVAHGVTLMVIQAGAARWLSGSDPIRADEALGEVELAGRRALVELQDLVGSLKAGPSEATGSSPPNEAANIRLLAEREARAGTRVELLMEGEPRDLDSGLELSIYRIVQEALTNVRKHARGATVRVTLTYTRDGVAVDVTDSGNLTPAVPPSALPGSGQGLLGIAERAALFGGHAEVGPTPEGGFRVRAVLKRELVPA